MSKSGVLACAATLMLSTLMLCSTGSGASFVTYVEPEGSVYDVRAAVPGLSFEKVNFAAAGQTERFMLRVDGVEPDADWVYAYFRVQENGLSGAPKDVVMDFQISKDWVSERSADLRTAGISIFDESSMSWTRIPSVKFSEDGEFIHFRAQPPSLEGFFAVTAEPVPVQIDFSIHCDADGTCEPQSGEDEESCGDCKLPLTQTKCAPYRTYCSGDSLFTCSSDGSDYEIQDCENGCLDGRCLEYPPATGMAVAGSPVFIAVVAALVSVIAYMVFSLIGMRKKLSSIERLR
jgi:PGF-pre-PGF domain-containing protein